MARPHTCRSFYYNLLLDGENELVRGLPEALTKGNNTLTPFSTVSQASTPTPTWISAPTPFSTNKLFKQFMMAYNQGPSQPPTECKRSFKAKVSDIYYGKSYIDCYHFF